MNFKQIRDILFEEAEKSGLSDYDVYFREVTDAGADTLKRELNACTSGTAGGVCFRCAVNGHLGTASSQDISQQALRALVARAVDAASVVDTEEPPIFYTDDENGTASRTLPAPQPAPDTAALRQAALFTAEKMYCADQRVTDGTSAAVGSLHTSVALANSRGLFREAQTSVCYSFAEAVIKSGSESAYGTAFAPKLDEESGLKIAKEAVEEGLSKLNAGTVKTGKYPVIFAARQMRELLSAFSGIFSGKQALLGISLLADKVGETVAAPCVNLTDDPFYPGNSAAMTFDAEGVPTYSKAVIRNGVLETLLYDLTTAAKAGCKTTGNAFRGSFSDPVSIGHFCLTLAPGKKSPDELKQALDNGIYVTELKGLHAGADATTGDFSIESAGFLIRGGEIDRPVRGFTISGNFYRLLNDISDLSDCVEPGLPGLSMLACPDVLVSSLSVAGE